MKRQLQIELDPTNNIERDINKNTVHSCLQLKLFEQDVGLQVCKTTKYVTTLTIQYTLNRSRAWSTMSSSEVTPPTPLSPPLVVCLKAWMWLEKVVKSIAENFDLSFACAVAKIFTRKVFSANLRGRIATKAMFFSGSSKVDLDKAKVYKVIYILFLYYVFAKCSFFSKLTWMVAFWNFVTHTIKVNVCKREPHYYLETTGGVF